MIAARPTAVSIMSATTAEAVGICPAPWPWNISGPTASPTTRIALNGPLTSASGRPRLHQRRRHVQLQRVAIELGHGQQLDPVAHLLGVTHVGHVELDRCPCAECLSNRTRAPNARWARIASFCAASLPSTSSVGSASA